MSNHKEGGNPSGRKPKVSMAMIVSHGLGGPKAKPQSGVAEGVVG